MPRGEGVGSPEQLWASKAMGWPGVQSSWGLLSGRFGSEGVYLKKRIKGQLGGTALANKIIVLV